MKRPNRYHYTRSQWEEETVDYFTYEDGSYFTSHVLKIDLLEKLRAWRFKDEDCSLFA
uniref:Uncharacterized protein n=1 Tax=Siphoviridae sp. ct7xv9 TaxID=2825355 RepID=A0A8S5PMZ8_9CAUD|nr:MAG TPA: hypothetical protein [Siphoviridae sp. ct7xv9]